MEEILSDSGGCGWELLDVVLLGSTSCDLENILEKLDQTRPEEIDVVEDVVVDVDVVDVVVEFCVNCGSP